MDIFAITHAQRNRRVNAYHTPQGFAYIGRLKDCLLPYIENLSKKVKILAAGMGMKHEELLKNFDVEFAHEHPLPQIIFTVFLGTDESVINKEGTILTGRGIILEPKNYIGIDDPSYDAWGFIKNHFGAREEGIALLFTGKPLMKALGKEEHFRIASVYQLFPESKTIKMIIRKGKILENSKAQ